MEPLPHPDSIHLSAAQGWLELANTLEAAAELEKINPALRTHPQVLELRWQLAVKQKDWTEALAIAELLCQAAPQSPFGWIHRSYCLHELKRTQEAWDVLLPLAETFPEEWLLRYNLACYACQLGRIEESKAWLKQAIEVGNARQIDALVSQDPDLRPLFRPPA